MLFGSSKKKGKQAGEILWQHLSLGFFSMENLPIGGFDLPKDFFEDDYTLSFTVSFVETLRIHQFSGKSWSNSKLFDFREAAYYEIDPSGGLLNLIIKNAEKIVASGETSQNDEQTKGAGDAYAIIGILLGFVSSDHTDPAVSDAKNLAEMMAIARPNEPFNIIHANSITTNTISNRTKERYGVRYNPNW